MGVLDQGPFLDYYKIINERNKIMTEQQRFLDAAKRYEEAIDQLKAAREELDLAMQALGLGVFIQDPDTKIVYNITKPNGTFMYYRDLDYIRTKKENERAGTLSVKKAQEAGFVIE